MSATGRGAERQADDFYSTPEWATRAIVRALPEAFTRLALDPCAGDGAILRVLSPAVVQAWGVELDSTRAAAAGCTCADFLTLPTSPALGRQGLTICTNPPYSLALEFVRRSLEWRPEYVVMLLRLNWLASKRRADFLRGNMPDVYVLPKRPSFTGKGTDATEYAWMVWRPAQPKSVGSVAVLDLAA